MLEDLICGQQKREFLDKNGQWKWARVRKYLKFVQKFEEYLLYFPTLLGAS